MSQNPPERPDEGVSRPTYEKTRFGDESLQRVHSQLMREKEEPSEGFSPLPIAFVFIFMILSFWAGIYLVEFSGDFNAFYYNEDDEQAPYLAAAAEGPAEVDLLALGARVYSQNCAICHQASGLGQPGVFPPLVNSDWVKDNPQRLIKVVLAGLQGQVVVNGQTYNNAMTAFDRLSDEQIAAVLTYIRTAPQFENNSFEVSPELVAEVRAEYGSRTQPWTQPDLEAIHGPVTGQWQPEQTEGETLPAEGEAPAEEAAPAPAAEA